MPITRFHCVPEQQNVLKFSSSSSQLSDLSSLIFNRQKIFLQVLYYQVIMFSGGKISSFRNVIMKSITYSQMEPIQQTKQEALQETFHSSSQEHSFFLFVNSGSGGGLGNKIVEQQIEKIEFNLQITQFETSRRCHAYFYNMRNQGARNIGFERLKDLVMGEKYHKQNPIHKCTAIVCGGDGTVMWVVMEMIKHGIQVLRVPIGIVPLGTGNDFSRELGWGPEKTSLLENNYKSLKKLIKLWIHAKEQYFDIWDVEAEIFENGKFQKVQSGQNSLIEGKNIKKTFCNYFSFGIDGKIGYSFDMHRTSTRIGNLAMYSLVGVAKTMTRTKTIDELLQSIEINHESFSKSNFDVHQGSQQQSGKKFRTSDLKGSKLFMSKNKSMKMEEGRKKEEQGGKYFNEGFYNILMLNVNSYTGGVKDIWEKAQTGFLDEQQSSQFTDVSTGDGKIQVVSFPSSMAIALERGFGGFSKKVAQGNGPFIFNFRRYENEAKHRTYLQIDGQFIRFTHPKRISVEHSKLIPKGKIKVLRRDPKYDPFALNIK